MGLFELISILITLAALFALINYHFIRLPMVIGVMVIALVCSTALIAVGEFSAPVKHHATQILASIDFNQTVLHGMLAFLLFAGALHIDLAALKRQRAVIALLATLGVLVSTFIVGGLTWVVLKLLGLGLPLILCLIFGSLISPTDPIAVLGIMKTAGAPEDLEMQVAGESLFNDGIGVVVFLLLVLIAFGGGHGEEAGVGSAVWLFVQEALGGVVLGLALGYITYRLLKTVDNYQVEVLLTLALAMGGYALAETLHCSAPIAIVCAGLLIGNHGRAFAMSDQTRQHLDTFWELVDEILNAVLFLLIGLEVLVMPLKPQYFVAAAIAIPITLLARYASVSAIVLPLSKARPFMPGTTWLLTWAGLRGGISVALALSLPSPTSTPGDVNYREVILAITYAVVVFSIIVQGLTVAPLVRRTLRQAITSKQEPLTTTETAV